MSRSDVTTVMLVLVFTTGCTEDGVE